MAVGRGMLEPMIRRLAPLALLAGCTSTPELGTYEITAHTWSAEIEVGSGQLACTAPGHPVDDRARYFALVSDGSHPGAVQYLRCEDPAGCAAPDADTAWFVVDGDRGINAQAVIERSEFDPPRCSLYLETFRVTSANDTLHVDRDGR